MSKANLSIEFSNHLRHQVVEVIERHLTFMFAHDIAGRVNEHQCGPSAARILLPHLELSVVNNWMFKLVAVNGLVNI